MRADRRDSGSGARPAKAGTGAGGRLRQRTRRAWTRDERSAPSLIAVVCGPAGFVISAWAQGTLGLFRVERPLLGLACAVLIEELIRYTWCLGFALLARRRSYPDLAFLGVLAAACFAAAENLAFYAANPETGVWARLVWSTPTHLNAALLAVLALARLARGQSRGLWRPASRLSLAFALALAWHGAYNAGAWAGPGPIALAAGGGLNVLTFLILLARASAALGAPILPDAPAPHEAGRHAGGAGGTPASIQPETEGQGDPYGNA